METNFTEEQLARAKKLIAKRVEEKKAKAAKPVKRKVTVFIEMMVNPRDYAIMDTPSELITLAERIIRGGLVDPPDVATMKITCGSEGIETEL